MFTGSCIGLFEPHKHNVQYIVGEPMEEGGGSIFPYLVSVEPSVMSSQQETVQ